MYMQNKQADRYRKQERLPLVKGKGKGQIRGMGLKGTNYYV